MLELFSLLVLTALMLFAAELKACHTTTESFSLPEASIAACHTFAALLFKRCLFISKYKIKYYANQNKIGIKLLLNEISMFQ